MRELSIILSVTVTLSVCLADESAKVPDGPIKQQVATITKILETELETQTKANRIADASQSALEKEARAVFAVFWDPKHLKQYGKREGDAEMYADLKYLIVQSELRVAKCKQPGWSLVKRSSGLGEHLDEEIWAVHRLRDFRSDIEIPGTKVIRLTDSLEKQLNQFLGEDLTEAETPNIMDPSKAKGVSNERLEAANSVIRVLRRHWGNGWHLVSHPEVTQLLFDWKAERAIIAFRIGWQGGVATFDKASDGWKMTESKFTWLE